MRLKMMKSKHEFSAVFDHPDTKQVNRYFVAFGKRNDQQILRLGLVVAKKRARRAVDRNYLKRAIKATLQLEVERLAGWDIVVLLRHSEEIAQALKHKRALYASLRLLWHRFSLKSSKLEKVG